MPSSVSLPIRVAFIGAGGISNAHAHAFVKHPDQLRCVALCDVSEENLKKRSDQLSAAGPAPRTFGDWKVMLKEMAGQIDAVDICLPHHLHCTAILDSAAAGKHILCEKPMCMSLAEADKIAEAVKRAGVTYMSAHNQLFMPVVQEAKRMIDSGAIGKVMWLRSQDCFRAGGDKDPFAGSWRAALRTQGGGELIDTGYHPSYRLLYLAGSPIASVQAQMGRYVQTIEGEDTASVTIRFQNGAIGEILTSWAFALPHGTHQIHIIGDKGQIFGSENTLYHIGLGQSEPHKREFPQTHTFTSELLHFAQCLSQNKRPIHSVEEGRAVLELILRATQSAGDWRESAVKKV